MTPTATLHRLRLNRRSEWLVVELTGGDGLAGYGECSDACDAETAATLLGRLVAGGVPSPDQAWRWAVAAGGDLPSRTIASGLAAAWEDLNARRAGQSLSTWLGGGAVPDVPTYANINRGTTVRTSDGFATHARSAVAAGYRAVKLAPFDGLEGSDRAEQGLVRVQAVRAAVGADVGVMVDVHHVLRRDELLRIAPELRDLAPTWVEDVAPLDEVGDLLAIKSALDCPLAGGEHIGDLADVRAAVVAGALDVVMPDVKHAGGARRTLDLARRVWDMGCAVALHNPTGPVATATSGQVLGALGTGVLEIMVGEAGDREGSVVPRESVHGGYWRAPGATGIGLTLAGAAWDSELGTRTWS
ncbi:hypothetical protein ALI144C_18930 [Actinosynnema sp. ALI-1.44]|uniref:enolase C-terminal domain-like protein n=1 Tax=Actinosynnema sp. ALI-1.44 TaxID=1933779 RepID=UPI00097C7405|nr:enolase C-terminal domain-like protein [Actinosynnema sp. ALI-1.44]ONI81415.1 hypothetical protein ALI144C_18930 [Actinosynnema sp. ALI-1.44]